MGIGETVLQFPLGVRAISCKLYSLLCGGQLCRIHLLGRLDVVCANRRLHFVLLFRSHFLWSLDSLEIRQQRMWAARKNDRGTQ